MRNLLEEFLYDNVILQEQYTNHGSDVDELLRLADKNPTKLYASLTDVQKELLQKYDDRISGMNSIIEL